MFLIDENLPRSVGEIFEERGFQIELVHDSPDLRHKPDEAIFDYAIRQRAIIITRDIGFANTLRFPISELPGMVLLRFPNEITTTTLCAEVKRLTAALTAENFNSFIVIEPGLIRIRTLRQLP